MHVETLFFSFHQTDRRKSLQHLFTDIMMSLVGRDIAQQIETLPRALCLLHLTPGIFVLFITALMFTRQQFFFFQVDDDDDAGEAERKAARRRSKDLRTSARLDRSWWKALFLPSLFIPQFRDSRAFFCRLKANERKKERYPHTHAQTCSEFRWAHRKISIALIRMRHDER